MPDQTGWIARGAGTPDGFTVTKAGVSDRQHIVYGIDVGLSEAGIALVTMKDGTSTAWEQYVHNGEKFPFAKGIPMTKGNAVNVTVASIATTGGSPDSIVAINLHGSTF